LTKLRTLDLFSGIGGFSLGLESTGFFETTVFCEIEPYPRAVLRRHWRGVPIYNDIKTLKGNDLGAIEVICGGFPCQDISGAGKGAGITGERSGLWFEYARLISEIRPEWVVIENVSMLRSRGLDSVLWSLAEIGYDAEWHCIPATYVGAPHSRDRIWIVAYPQRNKQPRQEPRLRTLGRVGRIKQPLPWDRDWKDTLATLRGMDDGFSRSVDRTDCLRNAIVPQVAQIIGYAIADAHHNGPHSPDSPLNLTTPTGDMTCSP
jgi:DNA (cytosine-5)-methyltransferase 1